MMAARKRREKRDVLHEQEVQRLVFGCDKGHPGEGME
jgi:hypothetical protein